jgi:hypothetical protein
MLRCRITRVLTNLDAWWRKRRPILSGRKKRGGLRMACREW